MKEENQAIIKALNMYGRVPETWELLEEIERLNKELTDTKNFKNSILEKLEKRTLERDKLRERLKVGKKVK